MSGVIWMVARLKENLRLFYMLQCTTVSRNWIKSALTDSKVSVVHLKIQDAGTKYSFSPHYLCVTRMLMFLKANFNSARKRVRNIVLVCVAISINSIARTSLQTTTACPDLCTYVSQAKLCVWIIMLVGHMTVPCRLQVIELHMGRIRKATYKRNITGWTRTLYSFDNEVDDDVRQVYQQTGGPNCNCCP